MIKYPLFKIKYVTKYLYISKVFSKVFILELEFYLKLDIIKIKFYVYF